MTKTFTITFWCQVTQVAKKCGSFKVKYKETRNDLRPLLSADGLQNNVCKCIQQLCGALYLCRANLHTEAVLEWGWCRAQWEPITHKCLNIEPTDTIQPFVILYFSPKGTPCSIYPVCLYIAGVFFTIWGFCSWFSSGFFRVSASSPEQILAQYPKSV